MTFLKYAASACLSAVLALSAPSVGAQPYVVKEVMSGLLTPRGMTFGPDGALYVTEAGSGGSGPSITQGNGATAFFGNSGGLSKLQGGVQQRVLNNLPSLAQAGGAEAGGLQDILFNSSGQAYGLFGLGGDPAQRSLLGAAGAEFGTIARLALDGSGLRQHVADIAGHELLNNPAGGTVDSNPFSFAMTASGSFLVADAGGNAALLAGSNGVVTTAGIFPAQPNPLPFGPPVFQAVPTAAAIGPDGAYYIGQLTGFPFVPGAANVYRIDPATLAMTTFAGGFTNIIDLTFGPDGSMYVLQISSNGLASPNGPGSGKLVKVAAGGQQTVIVNDGLEAPGSVLIGPDGTIYVTSHTNVAQGGQVLSITAVPEPASMLLWLVGGGMLLIVVRGRQQNSGPDHRRSPARGNAEDDQQWGHTVG